MQHPSSLQVLMRTSLHSWLHVELELPQICITFLSYLYVNGGQYPPMELGVHEAWAILAVTLIESLHLWFTFAKS